MSLASDRDALNCVCPQGGFTGSELRTAPANFRFISGVAILLPVSEGVGLWSQSCASLSGHLYAVRHLPSGEYGFCLQGRALCAVQMVRSREPCAGLSSHTLWPSVLDAARRLVFSRISSPPPDPGATTAVSSLPLSGSDSPRPWSSPTCGVNLCWGISWPLPYLEGSCVYWLLWRVRAQKLHRLFTAARTNVYSPQVGPWG